MSDANGPGEPDFNETTVQLNEGLRSCRALLSNYRVLLTEHRQGANDDEQIPANDGQMLSTGEAAEDVGSG